MFAIPPKTRIANHKSKPPKRCNLIIVVKGPEESKTHTTVNSGQVSPQVERVESTRDHGRSSSSTSAFSFLFFAFSAKRGNKRAGVLYSRSCTRVFLMPSYANGDKFMSQSKSGEVVVQPQVNISSIFTYQATEYHTLFVGKGNLQRIACGSGRLKMNVLLASVLGGCYFY